MKKLFLKQLLKRKYIRVSKLEFGNNNYLDLIAIFLCILFSIAGMLVSLHRYWQYEVFFYDFGIFDQAIWNVSRWQPPIFEHLALGTKWIFADHFSPGIFFLSPLYWFTDKSEILLISQSTIVGVSGFVLYKIGEFVLKNKFYSLSVVINYLLFVGLQNAVISDFHELTIMTLPLMLSFWFLIKRKTYLFFFLLLLMLSFKETTFLVGIGIAVFIIFFDKKMYKAAGLTLVLSIMWGILSIKFIIPYFSGGTYIYAPTLPEGILGKTLAFVDHPLKRETLLYSFWSFGFLPFLAPGFWVLLFSDYGSRFLTIFCCSRWDLGLHYNAPTAVVLALSSVFGIRFLLKTRFKKYMFLFCILLILNSLFLYRFKLHGPFALAYNPAFYEHTKDFRFLDELVKKVPKRSSIMTQNNLAVRFTHQKVWLLTKNFKDYAPEYIVIDNRLGQNPNNFFLTKDVPKIIQTLQKDSSYRLIFATEEQFLFKKRK